MDGDPQDLLGRALDVLGEIAYLLRHREDQAYRARAFTRACLALVLERPDLAGLRRRDELQSIEGVGGGIARVLAELVDTGQSGYLERLRSEAGLPDQPGSDLSLAGYRGDLHSHSTWSDGGASIREMAE